MSMGEVADLVTICGSFPRLPRPEIWREVALDAVDRLFAQGHDVVIVEGDERIGKTVMLSQFVRRYRNSAVSLFIRASGSSCSIDVLRYDIANQLEWILKQRELQSLDEANQALLRDRLTHLQKLARRTPYYFVIDGLLNASTDIVSLVIDMLPLGYRDFRFLFSGDAGRLATYLPRDIVPKPYTLGAFSLPETRQLLADLQLGEDAEEDLHRACGKLPGHLASARRSLEDGSDIDTILANPDWLEVEWRNVVGDEVQHLVLAILAFGERSYGVAELARILSVEPERITASIGGLPCVELDSRGNLAFSYDSARSFAQRKLRHLEGKARDAIVSYLLKAPQSTESLDQLPDWLERSGMLNELLEYLSPENFVLILEQSQSLAPLRRNADIGMRSARSLGRSGDLLRFAIQKATITAIGEAQVWRSEVMALMSVGDYDGAMTLAQGVVLNEDRLHLLAVIARAEREQGLECEPELLEQMRTLYSRVDAEGLGDRAVEIAIDLVYSNVDLAIELIDRASGIPDSETTRDWALARLSAEVARTEGGFGSSQNIKTRISDPAAIRFANITTALVADCPAAEVIWLVKDEKPKDQLYLLSRWLMHNREMPDVAEVISAAFQIAIRLTPSQYVPARDFRRVATALPYVKDPAQARRFVSDFDAQLELVKRTGPTEDYVRLQLLLGQTESSYDRERAMRRLADVYTYICALEDVVVRAACLARLLGEFSSADAGQRLIGLANLDPEPVTALERDVAELLAQTANQDNATRSIVDALGRHQPQLARSLVVERLNTEVRRNDARLHLLRLTLDRPIAQVDFAMALQIIDDMTDDVYKDDAVCRVLLRASRETPLETSTLRRVIAVVDKVTGITEPIVRCQCCCLAYAILVGHDQYAGLARRMLVVLKESWESIDARWDRIDTGYRIVTELAEKAAPEANEFHRLTDAYRRSTALETEDATIAYLACARLALRAFSGLLPKHLDTEKDFAELQEIIDRVPSRVQKASLWSTLALELRGAGRLEDCTHIVEDHLQPLILEMSPADKGRAEAVILAAPALYCAHAATAVGLFTHLPKAEREHAVALTCQYLMRKTPPTEPYSAPPNRGPVLTAAEAMDILNLMDLVETDDLLYRLIKAIADSVDRQRDRFPSELIHHIASRLEQLIESKLPDPSNISHSGYYVIARGQVARIRRETRPSQWIELADQASAIDNCADRALVLSILAASMPKRESTRSVQLLVEARELVAHLPYSLDQMYRYLNLAECAKNLDRDLAKDCIRAANSLPGSDDEEYDNARRHLVDLAYSIDENFAASIAEALDDEPARKQELVRRRLALHNLERQMVQQKKIEDDQASLLPQVTWMLLGGLNGGNVRSVAVDATLEALLMAGNLPIGEAYPIMSWVIQNAKARLANTDQAQELLRPLFRACVLGAQLAAQVSTRSSERLRKTRSLRSEALSDADGVFRAGDREKVVAYLRRWFEEEVQGYLKICDPYFGPEELEILALISEVKPDCRVEILTSQEHHREYKEPLPDVYRSHWRSMVSSVQDPPETFIAVVGTRSSKLPIHDRWWLTEGAGLRMGPIGHIGITRTSEISRLPSDRAAGYEREVDDYLNRRTREHSGEPLTYYAFTL